MSLGSYVLVSRLLPSYQHFSWFLNEISFEEEDEEGKKLVSYKMVNKSQERR